jgi:hypothetical protein
MFRVVDMNFIGAPQVKDIDEFSVQAHCEIAEDDSPGGEAVVVYFVGKRDEWAPQEDRSASAPKGIVVVDSLEREHLISVMQEKVDGCKASTWDELERCLGRDFEWV